MFRNLLSVVWVMALVLGLAGAPADAGLVGYWPLDDNFVDAVSGTVGTSGSSHSFIDGYFGKAYSQTAAQIDTLRTGAQLNIDGNKARTVSFWTLRPTGTLAGNTSLFRTGTGGTGNDRKDWSLSARDTNSNTTYRIQIWGQTGTDFNFQHVSGTWHHWVMHYDPSTRRTRVYIDGQLKHTHTASANLLTDGAASLIIRGTHNNSGIDDFGVFDQTLDAGRIRAIGNLGRQSEVRYELGNVSALFDAYDGDTSVIIADGREWAKFTDGSGTAGSVASLGNKQYQVFLDGTSGMVSSFLDPDAGLSYLVPHMGDVDLVGSHLMPGAIDTWKWYVDLDDNYATLLGEGQTLNVSYSQLLSLGMIPRAEYDIKLLVEGPGGSSFDYATLYLNAPVAEPASLGLLGLALLGLRKRRS